MRKASAAILLALAGIVFAPRPAFAQWDWLKWLEELSGPGHFIVNGVQVTFLCTADRPDLPIAQTLKSRPAAQQVFFCDSGRNWKHVKSFWGVYGGYGRSNAHDGKPSNPFTFPAGVTALPDVLLKTAAVTGTYRAHPMIDATFSVGFTNMTATPGVGVNKLTLDPSVVFRPLAWDKADKDTWWERLIEFKVGVLLFPEGFVRQEFGATGGPDLSGKGESIWHVGFTFNFVTLFDYLKRR